MEILGFIVQQNSISLITAKNEIIPTLKTDEILRILQESKVTEFIIQHNRITKKVNATV